MRKNTGLVTGVVNLFVQNYDNFINLGDTGAEEDGLPVFQYEEVRALFYGFEVEAVLHGHEMLGLWEHDLDLIGQVDYVRATNESNDQDLPRIPPLRTIVGLEYGYKGLFGADVEGVFVSKQDKVAEGELPTDSYALLNASLNVNVPVGDAHRVTLFARGTNLTDNEARVHSSFIKDLAPLRGRSVLFGVRAKL